MAPKKTLVKTTKKTIRESVKVLINNQNSKTPISKSVSSNEKIEVYTIETPQEPETLEENDEDDEDDQQEQEQQDDEQPRIKKEIKVQYASTPERAEAPKKTAVVAADGRKRRRRRGGEGYNYKRYLYRVLKQVHPDLGITSKTMTVIDNMMCDMFERLAEAAGRLLECNKKMTLSSREIQAAVKLVVPGELGKHAVAEGSKAVASYVSYGGGRK